MSATDSAPTIQDRIKTLEEEYQKRLDAVTEAKEKLISDERALLKCLQTLVPLQNTFLSGVIQQLQGQVTKLNDEKKANQTRTNRVRDSNLESDI